MRLAIYDLIGAIFSPPDSMAFFRSEKLFSRVCDVVRERFEDPDVTPDDVAAEAGISRRYLQKLYLEMHDLQYRMGKPTIAALTGPARAAGVTLAVSCDCIVASDTASLGYPEIMVGVIPAMHFVHLPRQIGRHKAFELLFTGKPIGAHEACAMGLVNQVVPAAEVKDAARALARDFAQKSPLVMELARDAFMRANDFEYRRAIENTVETICNIIETDDAQEGLAAFNEKRPPRW